MRSRDRLARVVALGAACVVVPLAGLVGEALAEIPALAREFRTERYVSGDAELESVRAQRHVWLALSGGLFQRGGDPGSADPFGEWKQVGGGTLAAGLQLGRYTLAADGTADTHRHVDGAEFPLRVLAAAYVPEARTSLVGSVGFGEGRYAGVDLTAEVLAARWKAVERDMDLYPRIWAWARVRRLDGDERTVLTPAVAMFLQHAIVVGSQVYAGASAQADLAGGALPVSRAMLQLGWGSVPRPLWSRGDPESPTAEVSDVSWNWYTTLAWAVPLDDRDDARFVAQFGLRFLRPFGR